MVKDERESALLARFLLGDLNDLVGLLAAWSFESELVSLPFAHQGFAERREV